jgi:hypothetical protein
MENCNFACGSVWVESFVTDIKEEHRLRVYKNRMLRSIFWPKRDKIIGGWRKLHNEELHNLYSSLSIIRIITSRRMRCAGHAPYMGAKRNIYRVLVGKPVGNRPLGKPRHMWILEKWDGVVWTGLMWIAISTSGGLL